MMTAPLTPPRPRRLVIVEDEGILALDLERHLSSLGYDVRGVAGDGASALALIERERPDLVLMDIRIQGPADGVETVTKLKARADVPIVYLTAHSDPKTIERAQQTQPMGYLLKPFKKADLQNVVAIALARGDLERQLRRREEALRTTLDCIAEGIVTTDVEGRVASLNPAAAKLAGMTATDAHDRPLAEVLPLRATDGGSLGESPVAESLAHGRHEFQARLDTSAGPRALVGTAASIRASGSTLGVVLALRDLSELLAARKQLEFAERLSALGTLAAGMAHEVNNPLTVVLANVSYALTTELSPDLRDALREAEDAAQRVARIINDLRSFSKPQAEALVSMDPRGLLSTALSLTRSTWKTVASVDVVLSDVPLVAVAPTRLAQVLVNLIINASQAMDTAHPSRERRLTLSSHTDARGWAVLSVRDTGPGVPDTLHERIFEPFFTTKPPSKGTGLGLAVSRNIVEGHGATLRLETSESGACFSVALPPAAGGRPAPAPVVCWVGSPRASSASAGLTPVSTDVAAVRTALAAKPDLVLLALEPLEAAALMRECPELALAYRVSDEPAPCGFARLLEPFDAEALRAFVRKPRD